MAQHILFLQAAAGGGHHSITQAISQALLRRRPDLQITARDNQPAMIDKIYQQINLHGRLLYHSLYRITNQKYTQTLLDQTTKLSNLPATKRLLKKYRPDLVVVDEPLSVPVMPLALEQLNLRIPWATIGVDLIDCHSVYFNPATHLFTAPSLAIYQLAVKHGLQASQIKLTGFPIRSEFFQKTNRAQVRRQLGLQPDKFTILFGGSGMGIDNTLEIIIYLGARPARSLLKQLLKSTSQKINQSLRLLISQLLDQDNPLPRPDDLPHFQAIFVTGNNTQLKEQLEQLSFPSYITPLIVGQTDQMAQYLHAADLTVGKAGPNLMLESAASLTPFLATYHVKGQEAGNIDYIRTTGIGWVEEKPAQAAIFIEHLLRHPKVLKQALPGLRFTRQQHQSAADKIAKHLLSLLANDSSAT